MICRVLSRGPLFPETVQASSHPIPNRHTVFLAALPTPSDYQANRALKTQLVVFCCSQGGRYRYDDGIPEVLSSGKKVIVVSDEKRQIPIHVLPGIIIR